MKISLKNGAIEKCNECGLNHYKKTCPSCKKDFITRNANEVRYCSPGCGRKGKVMSLESRKKITESLKKTHAKRKEIKKRKIGI